VRCAGTRSATSDRRRAKSAGARHTEGSGTAAAEEEEEEEEEEDDADEDEEDEAREAAHIAREATRNARESMEEQGKCVRLANRRGTHKATNKSARSLHGDRVSGGLNLNTTTAIVARGCA
jgi:hypothetical protein